MIIDNKAAKLFCIAVAFAFFGVDAAAADSAKEVAAIHAVDQAWLKAFNAGDADTMAKLYDEHATLLPPGAPGVSGRAAIRDFLAKAVAGAAKDGLAFSLGPKPDGGVSGNMGWASGTYSAKDKSGKVLETGKYLSVQAKKGGKWLYVRDTWNSDAAPPSAAPAPQSAPPAPLNAAPKN